MAQRELIAICGRTGSGKSTKLHELLERKPCVVALDPANDADWTRRGYKRVTDLPELSAFLGYNWGRGFRVVVQPAAHLNAQALDKISHLLFAYQEKVVTTKRKGEIVLAVDEMAVCFSNAHQQSREFSGFSRVLLQGRHANISVYGVTQRPQDVGTQFRANCDRHYFFALAGKARDAVIETIGREHTATYAALADKYEFLEFREGRISKKKTRKP